MQILVPNTYSRCTRCNVNISIIICAQLLYTRAFRKAERNRFSSLRSHMQTPNELGKSWAGVYVRSLRIPLKSECSGERIRHGIINAIRNITWWSEGWKVSLVFFSFLCAKQSKFSEKNTKQKIKNIAGFVLQFKLQVSLNILRLKNGNVVSFFFYECRENREKCIC